MLELEVEEGPNRGARYALVQGSATIGRDVACEVSVIDERASRKHAKLELTREGALTVEDQGSRNGTLLNGLPLEPGVKAPLAVGDRIAIGGTTLLLTASPGAALASSPTVGPTRAIRPLVAPGEARPAGASGPRDPARVLSLLQKLGALLSSGAEDHDPRGPLGCAPAAALEVAGGERAALLAAPGEKAPVRVLAATHDPPPGLPQDALLALSRTGAIELDTDGSSLVAVSLPGRKDERHAALVVAAATGARADAGAWAAVASALAPHVAAAEEARERRLEAEDARRALKGSLEIVAESPSMRRVLEQAAKAASGSAGVLILGESGSGKELVARAIHAASARAKKRFVAVNASAFPETLLESELFGHERGAFTGAVARRKGLFELADRGTLFLDEVAELALATQPKLLRVLETGEVRPLGGSEALSTDVRILAATNKDLRDLVRKGLFSPSSSSGSRRCGNGSPTSRRSCATSSRRSRGGPSRSSPRRSSGSRATPSPETCASSGTSSSARSSRETAARSARATCRRTRAARARTTRTARSPLSRTPSALTSRRPCGARAGTARARRSSSGSTGRRST
ncbi:sigma 54-interacting transcriptional regulator [bacterium]|nr:sigma 54-interacting transcriptional regulator [bacterium]